MHFHGKIYNSITELVGATPLLRLRRLSESVGVSADICAKLEYLNPMSSVKDRIGVAMLDTLEKQGKLSKQSIIIEPTSGNTGIALAFVCASRGYRLILCMPENTSAERRKLLILLGAEIEFTDSSLGMAGAIDRAHALQKQIAGSIIPQQFVNPSNPAIHRETTAEEIWRDCEGQLDILICGVGTGGTLTGIASILKPRLPNLHVVAVEPEDSAVLSGGAAGRHLIEGIGAGFVPSVLEQNLIDEVVRIGNFSALAMLKQLAGCEGLAVGISSGAALSAAVEIAQRNRSQSLRIVVILPSAAERYLSSSLFDDT